MACLSNGTDDAPAAGNTEQSKRKRPDTSTAEECQEVEGKGTGRPILAISTAYDCTIWVCLKMEYARKMAISMEKMSD